MTKSIKYKIGFGLVFAGLLALPFVACTEDDDALEPTRNDAPAQQDSIPQIDTIPQQDTIPTQPDTIPGSNVQKHNVELVYGDNVNTQWENISLDTLNKYNADPTVDSIFMVLEDPIQYSTSSTNGMRKVRTRLLERHNVNPNKIFGKGEMFINRAIYDEDRHLIEFFNDTLKYYIILHRVSTK